MPIRSFQKPEIYQSGVQKKGLFSKKKGMNHKGFFTGAGMVFLLLIHSINAVKAQDIPQELRGVWVATVANIDWPSRPGLDVETQKSEALAILDKQQALGMNAVFFQVRPAADAFFASSLEPWSRFLTGLQGTAPQPYYDPLAFWISEAHKRGLELHAWLNPFRASFSAEETLHPTHALHRHPEWLLKYGERYYFDPGLPEVRKHLLLVVADLVARYDVDGIHFDDYFYPYPIAGEAFADTLSFSLYGSGIPEELGDWRRENVNRVIRTLNDTIKHLKPWVKFGVSPFGVWRNKASDPAGSDTRAGVQCYDDLYADILLWEHRGWVDYVMPQIYWTTRDVPANFTKLIHWWNQNLEHRHLYVGHALYKINPRAPYWDRPSEIPDQIRMARELSSVSGSVFFSQRHFSRSDLLGMADSLSRDLYCRPALTPNMPWIDSLPPMPVFNIELLGRQLSWYSRPVQDPLNESRRYVIYLNPLTRKGRVCGPIWFVTGEVEFNLPRRPFFQRSRYELSIIAVDRLSNPSSKSETIKMRF